MITAEVRELDVHELEAVSGGSARDAAAIAAYAVIHRIDALLNEKEPPAPYVPMKL
jgi:hypothetical protein